MVARINSGKSIRGILVYNEQKVEQGQAEILLASGFATEIARLDFHQKLFRFRALTQLNARSRTNAMHITLNFHSGDRLDTEKLQQIALEYMEKLGLCEQPFIAYQHFDAAHPHLHIATVLIDRNGDRINTNNMARERSEPARKELELKFGLIAAQGRRLEKEPYLRVAEYGSTPTKKQLANITGAVMRGYAYASFEQYRAVLVQFGVHVERGAEDSVMFRKKGLVYSIIGSDGNPVGVPFKASSFYGGATMKELERRFEKNREKRSAFKQGLKERIDGVIDRFSVLRRETLVSQLAREQVALLLRANDAGLIYGVTFVDHRHRTVFNGSDLGKAYAAKVVTAMFSDRDVPKQYLRKEPLSNFLEKDLGPGGKQVKEEESLLDGLLEKADYDDPPVIGKKRKRRPGEEQSQNL